MANRSSKGLRARAHGARWTKPAKRSGRVFSACPLSPLCRSSRVAAQPPRPRADRGARAARDRAAAGAAARSRSLAAEERTLLGDLRKLEIERQIKAEELKRIDARRREGRRPSWPRPRRAMDALQTSERDAARPELERASSKSTSSARRATCGCCSRRPTSRRSARRRGRSPRSPSSIASASRRTQQTLDELTADARDARERARASSRRCAADAERAQAAVERAAQARTELVRDIDRRRDLNAQLAGELQAAQQKLQATLRDLAAGAPRPSRPRCRCGRSAASSTGRSTGTVARRFGRSRRAAASQRHRDRAPPKARTALAVHDGTSRLRALLPDSATW